LRHYIFFIDTYPLNAYPDPWDFAVDKYDIIIIEVDRTNDYELNLRSTIVYRTYKLLKKFGHRLRFEKRGIRRVLKAPAFLLNRWFSSF
jgi:hypothetical protein